MTDQRTYENILVDVRENVCTIAFNRPEARNAVTNALLVELEEALLAAKADPEVKALVLTGAGRGFCAGADLKAIQAPEGAERNVVDDLVPVNNGQRLTKLMLNMEKPIVGAVNGAAAGAGFSMALACDLIVASKSAFFVQTFATVVGVLPDCGSLHFLTQLLGTYRAKQLMFLGERVPAEKACELGFVNEVVEDDALQARAFEIAARLAKSPTVAIRFIKQLVNRAASLNLEESFQLEAFAQAICFATDDFREGTSSFVEKRAPQFKGR
ncbi:enoyl-CoA hydratase/isomerase family protein [Eggerthella sinensis]|uniref:Enoyl-CoA hydratase n=1 Tax=Eggerthella sinensis TaxID=242230 RepID=A0A3N0IT24_9ACTN|nr:enoyl-CoA hydratase-related protein [Eggerthella sinensis]RDB62904.1 enoyl-CoA hydratase [Eggerthella sinensis]RNM40133.1 enoyl-CoA hydratase [Eggerthella sinensis]